MKKDNGDLSSEPLSIPDGIAMTMFQRSTGPQFSLSEVFEVELSNEEKMKVFFDEVALIEALYTDSSFYSAIGQEFCLVFDIFYAKSGTEAVAESFYRVVEKQDMEGGQTIDILMNSAKIDWYLPSVIQCDSAITEMAKLYKWRQGNWTCKTSYPSVQRSAVVAKTWRYVQTFAVHL